MGLKTASSKQLNRERPYLNTIMFNTRRLLLILITCSLTFCAVPGYATIIFHVDVATSSLIGDAGTPFSLDYQLNDGSGTQAAPNTAVISNFTFNGGGALNSPTLFGDATGSLPTHITLSDANFFANEFFQAFTPGTKIGFDVSLTTNVDPGPTADAFSFSILDKDLLPIATTGDGDSLLFVDLNSESLGIGAIETFSSTSIPGVSASVSAIPEANALPALLAIGGFIGCFEVLRHRLRRRGSRITPQLCETVG